MKPDRFDFEGTTIISPGVSSRRERAHVREQVKTIAENARKRREEPCPKCVNPSMTWHHKKVKK